MRRGTAPILLTVHVYDIVSVQFSSPKGRFPLWRNFYMFAPVNKIEAMYGRSRVTSRSIYLCVYAGKNNATVEFLLMCCALSEFYLSKIL